MIFQKSKMRNVKLLFKVIKEVCPFRIFFSLLTVLLKKTNSILFSVLLIKYIVDNYSAGLKLVNIAIIFAVCGAFQLLTKLVSSYYYNIYFPVSNIKIEKYIRTMIYDKAKKLDLAYYDTPELYKKFTLAMSDSSDRIIELYETIISLIGSLYMVITTGLIMISIQPVFIMFVLLPLLVNMVIGKRFNKIHYKYNNEKAQNQRVRDYVNRCFYYKGFALDQKTTDIHNSLFHYYKDSTRNLLGIIKRNSKKVALFEYIYMITSDVIVYLGCILFSVISVFVFHTMTISSCIVVINTLNNMIGALWQIGSIYVKLDKNILFFDSFLDFLNCPIQIESGLVRFPQEDKSISFDKVTFRYPNSEKYIFQNLTYDIPYGQKIAIVGINGVGKTTLIKLLLRLYDPTEGNIFCGHQNIKTYNLKDYRQSFGVLFQDFQLYAFSLANNIAMDLKYDKSSISTAVGMAKLQEKIDQYNVIPDQMITHDIDEAGMQFSKGESQKLALSRLFYKDYNFIILDEPFSNLDLLTEKTIYNNLMANFREKTMIVISHRLASIIDFDKIIVMEDGQIIESGTHQQLMETGGLYCNMFNKQADAYKDDE